MPKELQTTKEREAAVAAGYKKISDLRTSQPHLFGQVSLNGVTMVETANVVLRMKNGVIVAEAFNYA